jgi:predicted Ser/Thr protein kinase
MTRDPAITVTAPVAATADAGAAAVPSVPVPGAWFGRYRIERLLGEGGMGVVFAAEDTELHRRVALKFLRAEDDAARERLVREARAMARVRHPHVITVYEVDHLGGREVVAMELIEGETLQRWLTTPRSVDELLGVFLQAARGLAAAHDGGLVHCDFKPHNVLVTRGGHAVVTDFGLARVVGAAADVVRAPEAAQPARAPAVTATAAVVGTPAYMPPEQWAGAPPEPRADQFAFCVSLWEALAGARPFAGATGDELCAAIAAGPPARPARIPRWLLPILRRGLAARPEARWPSMAALVAELTRAAAAHRRRHRAIAAALAVAAVAAVAAIVAVRASGGGPVAVARGPALASDAAACGPADDPSAELWTADRRARFARRLPDAPELQAFVDAFFTRRTERWRAAYAATCAAREDRQRLVRIACLVAWRDRTATDLDALEGVPPETLAATPLPDLVPGIDPCTAPSPVVTPIAPSEAVRRAYRALRADAFNLRLGELADDDAAWAALLARADALDFPPAEVELQMIHAGLRHARGEHEAARAAYEAIVLAAEEAATPAVRAMASLGIVEILTRLGAPDAEVDAAMRRADAALHAAGRPSGLAMMLELLEVDRLIARGAHDEAIPRLEALHAALVAEDDLRRAARVTAQLADALRARGREGDAARATAAVSAEIARQRALLGRHAVHADWLERVMAP